MPERPIIFSPPMVRAILAGRKTQTRRVLKPQPFDDGYYNGSISLDRIWDDGTARFSAAAVGSDATREMILPLRFCPGDRLWVRETVRAEELETGIDGIHYLADDEFRPIENSEDASMRWVELFHYRDKRGAVVPPIHMPRWASRITLRVTEVRVQRLQDISEPDAVAEGMPGSEQDDLMEVYFDSEAPLDQFRKLWSRLHGRANSWEANPWVVAITFERLE